MKLLLIGSTGLVGSHLLDLALADPSVDSIVALTRHNLAEHPKLQSIIVDFDHLPQDALWWQADAVICTLGTTIKKAGSKESFRHVDYDYPLNVAKLAHAHGTPAYVLNSALGANASSRVFYSRVKGELEQSLESIGFASLTFVRPGVISGERNEFRLGEKMMILGLGLMSPLLPKRWRLNPASNIAQALLDAAVHATAGKQIITSEQLV